MGDHGQVRTFGILDRIDRHDVRMVEKPLAQIAAVMG